MLGMARAAMALQVGFVALITVFSFNAPSAWAETISPAREAEEAADYIRAYHIFGVPEEDLRVSTLEELVERLIDRDPYIEILDADLAPGADGAVSGVGLKLLRENGSLLAVTHPNSPAARAGLNGAYRVLMVASREVTASDFDWAANRLRASNGEGGLPTLVLDSLDDGGVHVHTLAPSEYPRSTVWARTDTAIPVIRIVEFLPGQTVEEVRAALLEHGGAGPIALDLRYATGGDLQEALSVSALFLAPGQSIAERVNRIGRREHHAASSDNRPVHIGPLTIFVGPSTASAAEVVLRALAANRYAVTVGASSYGKCLAQRSLRLKSGRFIRFSTERLEGPRGTPCEPAGYEPTLSMGAELTHATHEMARRALKTLVDERE